VLSVPVIIVALIESLTVKHHEFLNTDNQFQQ